MESIKKETHLMKVQCNVANKYQISSSLGDQCVMDVVTITCSCRRWELIRIPCKHVVAACWNMAMNDQVAPPSEAWVNPCYWLTTWRETYSQKVGRATKKRNRSKHEDEPFVKDGKLSRKGRTITCQSCKKTGHNKETCKGQGRKATTGGNNAEASGSSSRGAHQTKPAIGQDGSGRSGGGAIIGLSVGQGGAGGTCGPCGAGVSSQGSSYGRWTKRRV
ncbi:crooked neck-like protein 1 [Tanacetum coccineum]